MFTSIISKSELISVRVVNENERERRRRENRGAEGAERGGVWGGGIPLPSREGSGEGAVPPPQKSF